MNLISWALPVLIALPLAGAVLAGIISSDRVRNALVVVLTEEGREFTTAEFSAYLGRADRKIVFVIGGPFGLAQEVKQRAGLLWSLSKLTFTHEMARFLFCEQLYRALNLLNGGAYHHF